nr:sarcosine dehydrogenase, mitochondrial-like [Macaca fascicularis]
MKRLRSRAGSVAEALSLPPGECSGLRLAPPHPQLVKPLGLWPLRMWELREDANLALWLHPASADRPEAFLKHETRACSQRWQLEEPSAGGCWRVLVGSPGGLSKVSTVYTYMLNHCGGTESDLTVNCLAPSHQASPLALAFEVMVLPFEGSCHLAVGRAVAQHNLSHITTVLQDQKFRCQLIDSSEDLSMVSIQGPASSAILQEGLDTHLSNEAFPFSTHKFLRASRHLVRATWLSFTGELGWGLHIPKVSCMPVYQAVMATGAKHDLVNAGHHAIDSLSIEKGECRIWMARGLGGAVGGK